MMKKKTKKNSVRTQVNLGLLRELVKELAGKVKLMNEDYRQRFEKLVNGNDAISFFEQSSDVALDAGFLDKVEHLSKQLARKWGEEFTVFGSKFSKKLIKGVDHQTDIDLKKLFADMMTIKVKRSKETKQLMKAKAIEASNLIVTIQDGYTKQVNNSVFRLMAVPKQTLKKFQEEFFLMLKDNFKKHRNKAINVAMDQTRKCYQWTSATKMMEAGVTKFIWRHTAGSVEPRKLHMKYNGKVFEYANPPIVDEKTGEKGLPATAINCKCYAEPFIELE